MGNQVVRYSVVGSAVSYRFEFHGSTMEPHGLGVVSGRYDAESLDETIAADAKHILSDLVKMIRIQNHQASHRTTALLEELVRVEAIDDPMVDSCILHGYDQRFQRLDYVKQLRAAIKDEVSCSSAVVMDKHQPLTRLPPPSIKMHVNKPPFYADKIVKNTTNGLLTLRKTMMKPNSPSSNNPG